MDVDLPPAHLDPSDEHAHQPLTLGEVELVDRGKDAAGEVLDAVPQSVVRGELMSLSSQRLAF